MKSLAEHLGIVDPRTPEAEKPSAPPKRIISEFCRDILASDEYRASLLRRLFVDDLAPAVEVLLYHYAHGKPVEKLEFKDTSDDVDEMTAEQCEQEAQRLLNLARELREGSEEDSEEVRSVH